MEMLVSSALEVGSSLPSFFEMFMTQQVELSLKPAARHAHIALAARWPRLHWFSRWFDEGYLVALLLLEARFLSQHSCLLSESFYGLRRCRYDPVVGLSGQSVGTDEDAHLAFDQNGAGYGPGQSLRARDRRKALLTAAVLPYVLAKLDAGHERSVAARAGAEQQQSTREELAGDGRVRGGGLGWATRRARTAIRSRFLALRSLFFQVYPLLRASYEGSCLVYQWLYLFRRSAFFSPCLRLTGMVVRRTTFEDLEEDAAAAAAAKAAASAATGVESTVGAGQDVGSSLGDTVGQYARVLLVAGVIGFKIVEWWTRVEAQEGPSWRRAQLPQPPPPPQPPSLAPGGCGVPADAGACPACGSARVNPALCATSGFVFCYRCLAGHVRDHGECPVTGLACGEAGVVRLYDDDEARG